MRKIILFCMASFSVMCLNAQRAIDVKHYRFDLAVSDKSDTLKGMATIELIMLKEVDSIGIDLQHVQAGKGFRVRYVKLGGKAAGFSHADSRLMIATPESARSGEELSLQILYSGIPADGLIISKNKFGSRTFFADNWPNRAQQWIPCVDEPGDKASVEFIVAAPAHYQVVSNGLLKSERLEANGLKFTHWEETIPLPTKIMVVGIADFAVEQSGVVNGVPISSWVFPQNKENGFKDYGIAPPIVQWLSAYIGPFPYKKLAHVQSKTIFGGMENAGAIFYFENSVNGKMNNESLIAHETAHQFFGDMVTEESFPHVWLSEGFATYMAHLYIASKYGRDTLANEMRKDRDAILAFSKSSSLPVVDSVSGLMDLLNTNSYQKGSWILHMLHGQLGDAMFRQAVREYYKLYAGRNANSSQLQQVFEKVSGKDLSVFFQQWLHVGGQPELLIKWSYDMAGSKLKVDLTQLQTIPFDFPLEILVSGGGKTKLLTLHAGKARENFEWPVDFRVEGIVADPGARLLFRQM